MIEYADNGQPLMCECGCKELEECNHIYEEIYICEYDYKCSKCGRILNHWAYGYWEYNPKDVLFQNLKKAEKEADLEG